MVDGHRDGSLNAPLRNLSVTDRTNGNGYGGRTSIRASPSSASTAKARSAASRGDPAVAFLVWAGSALDCMPFAGDSCAVMYGSFGMT